MIRQEETVEMPTAYGDFRLTAFTQSDTGDIHTVLHKGAWASDEPVLVRVHSSCITGDIFGSCRCDCGEQLHAAMEFISRNEKGLILYLMQEGRGIGLVNKLKAYKLQEQGLDTVEANLRLGFRPDEREYTAAAEILACLGVHKIRLLTNNPQKKTELEKFGIQIAELVPIQVPANPHNQKYLHTKKDKMGHLLSE